MLATLQALGVSKPAKVSELLRGDPEDKIVLITFPSGGAAVSSLTPFGAKVETLLRMADLPYEAIAGNIMNPKHAPRQKFPTLQHGANVVTDSSFIVEYLAATYPEKMAALQVKDPVKQGIAHAVKRMLEESLYWAIIYQNWVDDAGWKPYCPFIFSDVPKPLLYVLGPLVRSEVIRNAWGQGSGRFSFEDIMRRAAQDLASCSAILGDQQYLTGSEPCEADCTLFAMLHEAFFMAELDERMPLWNAVKTHHNLLEFHDRVKAKFYDGKPSKLRSAQIAK